MRALKHSTSPTSDRDPSSFKLTTSMAPKGDQPKAIQELVSGLADGHKHQVLLGVTGSGKTFTMANVIAQTGCPTLIIAPNKTLAAQLCSEFRELFPENAVEYFVSYYDYYQPEAYIPNTDLYIEKDSRINEEIDRMRHSATRSLLERDDVIIVASVSCIYGLGSAEAYYDLLVFLEQGAKADRDEILKKLVEIQYDRNDYDFHRGTFRVRGDVIEVFPAYEQDVALRIELWGDEVEAISEIDPLRGTVIKKIPKVAIYPGSHYVTTSTNMKRAIRDILDELRPRLVELRDQGKLLEAQRLEQRTLFDVEMMEQTGRCAGIENYSRHLTGRAPGEPPPCLLDYFPRDFLLFIDESHVTLPQIGAMYRGDRSRKETLVDFGFRLPSALDNRPLRYDEFEGLLNKVTYVSATPGDKELELAQGRVVEQLIRPTGLVDPQIIVRPATHQVDDLMEEVRLRVEKNERVLVTTLTKRMAEDLTDFMADAGILVRYLHSDIDTLERISIIRDLRLGLFHVLVGINLLREGLDIPEVSLVAILDADKEGFLRSHRSLIQTTGRAARNVNGKVIFYADRVTRSMEASIGETDRRRRVQLQYNKDHNITPETIIKTILDMSPALGNNDWSTLPVENESSITYDIDMIAKNRQANRAGEPTSGNRNTTREAQDIDAKLEKLEAQMHQKAQALEFEAAAKIRDEIYLLKERLAQKPKERKPGFRRRS